MASRGWEHVTAAQLLDRKPMAKAKYRNVKVTADGRQFDSKHELKVWRDLQARQAAGEIRELKHHPRRLPLVTSSTYLVTVHGPVLQTVAHYEPDFSYIENGDLVIADAKSPATRKNAIYRLKARWLRLQEGIEIVEL